MNQLLSQLRAIVGRTAVLDAPDELLVYECDGLPQHKHPPRAVVFPQTTAQVSDIMRVLHRARVPFVGRGAGTGLSGGAVALDKAVIIEMARMRRVLEVDAENQRAVVQTGLVNAQLSQIVAAHGLYYAPDPSSQTTCTIGGNIAENSGGIHCLKYGVTVDHVSAVKVVLSDGTITDLRADNSPYDLLGLFIGSEGTFGLATEATVRLLPQPPAVQTLLADFLSVDDASRAVSAIIAAGIIPAGLEMIDGATIRAVEASVFAAGMPLDAAGVLLIELDGLAAGLDEETALVEALCRTHQARYVRAARDAQERKKFWAARKSAFGAMGRLAPDLMLQDAVVPRSRLPEVLAETYRIGKEYNLRVANVFHAGDGNLHPLIPFDSRDADETMRVKEAGRAIMEKCVSVGGTITGEHGVGFDKSAYMSLIFNDMDLDAMLRVRAAFDPSGLCNPGKIIPLLRGCGEARAVATQNIPRQQITSATNTVLTNIAINNSLLATAPTLSRKAFLQHLQQFDAATNQTLQNSGGEENFTLTPPDEATISALLRLCTQARQTVFPTGRIARTATSAAVQISLQRLGRILSHEPADLVATAQAGVTLRAFNEALRAHGQWLPLDPPDDGTATLGGVVATGQTGPLALGYGTPRQAVLGMRVVLADGTAIKTGGRVVKNVAGYDLAKLFTGSRGTLGIISEITFRLRPLPAAEITILATGPGVQLWHAGRALWLANLQPVALEWLSAKTLQAIDYTANADGCGLLVRYAGTSAQVAWQTAQTQQRLHTDGFMQQVLPDTAARQLWQDLAACFAACEPIWHTQIKPSATLGFLKVASQLRHIGLGNGHAHGDFPTLENEDVTRSQSDNLADYIRQQGGTLVMENSPYDGAYYDKNATLLARRIKEQLDPQGIFQP